MTECLLQFENFSVSLAKDRRPVLRSINLSLYKGDRLGVAGESGCGKTTLALASALLLSPHFIADGGRLLIRGRDAKSLSAQERRIFLGRELGFVFQDPMSSLNPLMGIGDQIAERLVLYAGYGRAGARDRVCDMLCRVGLPHDRDFLRTRPHELSGGMRQRVMIAQAMVHNPRILIADEPTTALDPLTQDGILLLLHELCSQGGTALMLISHNMPVLASLSNRLLIMYAGRIAEAGEAKAVLKTPLHPYTQMLLSAIPSPSKRGEPLPAIGGSSPPCSDDSRCPFRSRCPRAFADCDQESALLMPAVDGRECSCLLCRGTR